MTQREWLDRVIAAAETQAARLADGLPEPVIDRLTYAGGLLVLGFSLLRANGLGEAERDWVGKASLFLFDASAGLVSSAREQERSDWTAGEEDTPELPILEAMWRKTLGFPEGPTA